MGTFKLKIGKNDCHIWNKHPRICRKAKNRAKETKIIFGSKVLYLGIFGCKSEKVLSYFQHPGICQAAKFRGKLKMLDFGTKKV